MTKIDKIIFCDNIEEGQFRKINIYGFIPGKSISVGNLPYNFISHIVLFASSDISRVNLELNIKLKDKDGKVFNTIDEKLDDPIRQSIAGEPPYSIFLIIPFTLLIERYGSLIISIYEKGLSIYEEKYTIDEGDAPRTKIDTHLPQSKLFTGANLSDAIFIQKLLASADKSLKIIDGYLTPADLRTLLVDVNPQTNIHLMTYPSAASTLSRDLTLFSDFPKLKVTYSDKNVKQAHDRIVIINETEYYHFGHSLKDIAGNKVSRVAKIIDREEVNLLLSTISEIEKHSIIL